MPRYVVDTGVLLGYLRASPYAVFVDQQYSPFTSPNIAAISIVTHGELRSLALQLQWGVSKQQRLKTLLRKVPYVDINNDAILQRYAEIDAFSQGKLNGRDLPVGMSARNMGKNDLWIAATASVLNATLITTDEDFDHLDGISLRWFM
ncbi:MAG: type II toxin-antitoxin system VapC family toxin [candidate division KSB1 bacterium]|nr:type II toxin-antitoxin system VapC family toxin [candidate division KSB1 bacterium]MDZ7367389.1 type II toxin-antitoxin system VapC family toxin [candidate division KSB1 bacterium]MDZ7405270.1 type II toxin-antitoxin system VapC family toxin [candidate division KSB1 bacterium]